MESQRSIPVRGRGVPVEDVEQVVSGLMHDRKVFKPYSRWLWHGADGEVRECRSLAKLLFNVKLPRLSATVAYLGDAAHALGGAYRVWRVAGVARSTQPSICENKENG